MRSSEREHPLHTTSDGRPDVYWRVHSRSEPVHCCKSRASDQEQYQAVGRFPGPWTEARRVGSESAACAEVSLRDLLSHRRRRREDRAYSRWAAKAAWSRRYLVNSAAQQIREKRRPAQDFAIGDEAPSLTCLQLGHDVGADARHDGYQRCRIRRFRECRATNIDDKKSDRITSEEGSARGVAGNREGVRRHTREVKQSGAVMEIVPRV